MKMKKLGHCNNHMAGPSHSCCPVAVPRQGYSHSVDTDSGQVWTLDGALSCASSTTAGTFLTHTLTCTHARNTPQRSLNAAHMLTRCCLHVSHTSIGDNNDKAHMFSESVQLPYSRW